MSQYEVEVPAGVVIRSERPLTEGERLWLCEHYQTQADVDLALELGRRMREALSGWDAEMDRILSNTPSPPLAPDA